MRVPDLNLVYELDDDELIEVGDFLYDIESERLKAIVEAKLHFPVISMRLYQDVFPFVFCVQIRDAFADLELCENWRAYCITHS